MIFFEFRLQLVGILIFPRQKPGITQTHTAARYSISLTDVLNILEEKITPFLSPYAQRIHKINTITQNNIFLSKKNLHGTSELYIRIAENAYFYEVYIAKSKKNKEILKKLSKYLTTQSKYSIFISEFNKS